MRCPKCQYISFDDADRCRNCGYQFSLSEPPAALDLPIRRSEEPIGPLADLALGTPQAPAAPSSQTPEPARPTPRRQVTPGGLDLPLFQGDGRLLHDDAPLVSAPAVPRAPLAVRRAAPVPRPRQEPRPDEPDSDLSIGTAPRPKPRRQPVEAAETDARDGNAPAGLRIVGALIDGLILGSIDAGVVYLTLELCGLTFAEVRALPPVPMAAFLLLLNGGYLTLFTAAGGQTIGKMLAGTRVVSDRDGSSRRVAFGTAVVRASASLLSLIPAGAGFLIALVRADGRALHDTLAETRVIRA
jgi:uncharacterized RDD family membrane protein YckC